MKQVLVAILAAGESRRMGAPKLCLPWNKTSVLGYLLAQWREAGAEKILVIHAPDEKAPVVAELDRLGIPAHERKATLAFSRGMIGSVMTAAHHALQDPTLTHLVIALGDQPHLQTQTLRALLTACETAPEQIIRILFQGKSGHPLALPASLLPELSVTPCATLRDFLSSHQIPVTDLTCSDSGILVDLDTPEDYAQARQSNLAP